MQRFAFMSLLLAATTFAGCSNSTGPTRYTVTGKVSYQGAPFAAGQIDFIPEVGDAAGAVTGEVKDGAYTFSGANGVPAGKYKVSINGSFIGEPPNPSADTGGPSAVIQLPDKYNATTELRAEVTAGGPNEFNFDLK
jgi:hypothetical protein